MFYSLSLLIFFLAVITLGQPVSIIAQGVPPVVINELMWMGSSASTADEWIELRNTTDLLVDISGWSLTKKSSGLETAMLTIPAGTSISPGGFFLVANYADSNANTALVAVSNVVDTDVALVNTALQVKLYDTSQTLIDTADDGSGNPLAGRASSADQIFWSMERNQNPGDGTAQENWHTASRGAGFDEGRPERGTPGAANSNGLPVAVAGPDLSGVVGQEVNFDASESTDPEQQPLMYSWDFGDGGVATGATPSHTYAAAGEFTATVSVSDGLDTSTDTLVVTISAAPATTTSTSVANPVPTSSTMPSAPKTSCRGAMVSEVFPNPAGVDSGEFIELHNPTKISIPLTGCTVWLNDKRRHIFPEMSLGPKEYFVLEKTVSKLSLTNTGGALRLNDTDGAILGAVEYPKAPEDESWAIFGHQWSWTNRVTAGQPNLEPVDDESLEAKKSTVDEAVTPLVVSLSDVQTLESGQIIRIQGVVTVTADILASRTIWLQDDTAALQALLAEDALRPVNGDFVEIIGTVRAFQGRKRISVKPGDVKVVASGRTVEPRKISLDQLSQDLADLLVAVEGVVSHTAASKILIDDGSGEGDIYIKSSTGIVKPKMAAGDQLNIIGVVSASTAGLRIMPRSTDDIRVERVLGANTTQTPAVPLQTTPASQTWWYWGLVALGGVVAMIKPVWRWWHERKSGQVVPPAE